MSFLRVLVAGLVALFLCPWTTPAFAEDTGNVISLQLENDFFGGGTDRHFSHGTAIECLSKPIPWITDLADKLPWFSAEKARGSPQDAVKARFTLSLGQNIYTPEDTQSSQLVQDDRPYAGWLYVGFGLAANQGSKRYDQIKLELGVVGPSSGAQEVQAFWHSRLGIRVPQGWKNQLKDEPGAVLYYEQARRIDPMSLFFGLEFDMIPHFGGALGNVFTYGATGLTMRLGPDLKDDFGPPRLRPSLPGGSYFRRQDGFNWYLFGGFEGRLVLRNIFLDGNTFADSHSVEKKPFVGDLQAGLVVQYERFRVSYTQIYRLKEFKGQKGGDVFGAVSLSYQF